ncbi:MAG TPA: hypothetical protein VJ507_05005 [Candidatus Bathyarchaeia archaeon]|nr:hypothetical protein [Candidatus Bathyarchaeia archaeon]
MSKKTVLLIVSLSLLTVIGSVSADVFVGVRKGDWIEYNVTYTGTPPEGHEVSWARMEVSGVQGTAFSLIITTKAPNGTSYSEIITLNLEEGVLGDDFVIPANLRDGDKFFDKSVGNITIGSVEARNYAGASRVVVVGSKGTSVDYWDQSTGVLLEGISSFADYSITAKVDKTNLWQTQQAGSDPTVLSDPTVFYVVAAVVIIAVAVAVILVARRKKK